MKKEWARLGSIAEMLRTDDQCAEKLAAKQFLPFYISLWLICLTGQHVLTAERRGGGEEGGKDRCFTKTQWMASAYQYRYHHYHHYHQHHHRTEMTCNVWKFSWCFSKLTRELLPGRAARTDKICWTTDYRLETTPAWNEWEWSPYLILRPG